MTRRNGVRREQLYNKFAGFTLLLLLLAARTCMAQKPGVLVTGTRGMVVSACERASTVGADILRQGGNAVDAAVAVGFALAVTYPSAGNLGGGAYIVIRMADGREAAIDAREVAPSAAAAGMYLDGAGRVVPDSSLRGPYAAGVPGSVHGLLSALSGFGSMRREQVLAPAIRLARNGYRLKGHEANFLESQRVHFTPFPSSARVYAATTHVRGELFRQLDLGETLARIAQSGSDGFYRGVTADLIVREMETGGGIITHRDLEQYRSIVRVPLRGAYRGFEIVTMPPSSAGGVALLQMLNILERHDRSSVSSPASIHRAVEAMRRAFADRWQHLGDPAFLSIDTDRLAGKEHAAELDRSIDPLRATPSDRLLRVQHPPREGEQTTHYSIVDRWGNAVSVTTTLNSICGGKCVVDGAGFLLNNEMDDFTIKPGEPNQFGLIGSDVNRIEPGKRMLSSMTPAIILREGVPVLVLGSPGGSTIPTAVLQVCLNVLDGGMPLHRAVASRRYHHQWMPDTLFHEPRAWDTATGEALHAMGHRLKERPAIGRVDAVLYDARKKLYYGCSDPRGHGAAVAW